MYLFGWKIDEHTPPETERCVLVAAPHTSNWDFPIAIAAFRILGIPIRFTIKQEWMRVPFKWLIAPLGGIAIDRRPKTKGDERPSMVDAMAHIFDEHERIAVIVTAEGTRSRVTHWKTGFYYIAQKANVPICLGYCDYERKIAGIGKAIHPSGDIDRDMKEIMDFYKQFKGRHPEKFALDERYA
jgi:1-acyl-sn-glycerol-3-phosphate acyltransferase